MRDEIAKIIWDRHYYRSLNGARDTADQILSLFEPLIQKAGDFIGTHPDLRNMACIDVAIDHGYTLREEVEELRKTLESDHLVREITALSEENKKLKERLNLMRERMPNEIPFEIWDTLLLEGHCNALTFLTEKSKKEMERTLYNFITKRLGLEE